MEDPRVYKWFKDQLGKDITGVLMNKIRYTKLGPTWKVIKRNTVRVTGVDGHGKHININSYVHTADNTFHGQISFDIIGRHLLGPNVDKFGSRTVSLSYNRSIGKNSDVFVKGHLQCVHSYSTIIKKRGLWEIMIRARTNKNVRPDNQFIVDSIFTQLNISST